jgi:hypothetical protein
LLDAETLGEGQPGLLVSRSWFLVDLGGHCAKCGVIESGQANVVHDEKKLVQARSEERLKMSHVLVVSAVASNVLGFPKCCSCSEKTCSACSACGQKKRGRSSPRAGAAQRAHSWPAGFRSRVRARGLQEKQARSWKDEPGFCFCEFCGGRGKRSKIRRPLASAVGISCFGFVLVNFLACRSNISC